MSDDLTNWTRPGHDRDVAIAIRSQANLGDNPVTPLQVEHLLRIGFDSARDRISELEAERDALAEVIQDAPHTEVNEHEIVWTFDNDAITGRVVCNDSDCLSRYVCPQPCEVMYDVRREADGTVTHKPWDDEFPAINRHVMEKADYCNVVAFLDEDPYLLPELIDQRAVFEIGRTSISPVWQGEDGVLWRPKSLCPPKEEQP